MKTKLISAVSILFILLTCCLPFFPSYSLNNHAASDYPEYQEEVDRILSEIKPSMSDLEKALAVHEYFIRNYKYGKADEVAILDYSEFDVFVNKSGVCESMTKAYKYIMDLLGISCIEADSPSMNHTWNMIKLDGYWYHVDVTFDLSGSPGSGQHQNFLLSDIGIAASGSSGHYGWTSTEKATNTQYDNAFWSMIRSYMYYNNGYWYYVDTGEVKHYGFVTDLSNQTPYGTISRYNFSSDEKTAVFKVDSIKYSYSDITGSTQEKTWKGNNTRLAMYNEKLYYNTYNQIFFINTDGSGNTPVCTVDIMGDSNIPDASSCIDGFIIKYGNIFYTNSYQSDQTYWTAALPSAAPMYAFKVSSNNGGTISPQYDVKVFGSTSRTFTLLPKEGFTVGDIIVDGVSVGPASVYSFKNVKADHSIQVVFKNTFAGSTAGSSSIASSGISAEEYSSWRLVSIAEQPDDKLYSFNKGSAILRKNNLCTVIDMNGNKTMPWLSTGMELGWEQASLSAGLYNVSSNGLSGYVDLTGKPIVPCEYSYIYFIAENLISAEKNGKRGLLDTTGSVILPFEYDSLYKNENGRIVVTKNGISKVLDDSGKLVSFTAEYDYSNMLNIQFKDGKWGIQNGLGKILVPYEYDGIKNFSEGIAQLQKDGRIGYTDKKGKMIAL
ncbi:MAG: hypothetical protein HGA22_12405, partial [Clostridiales bacterium]|nr:hypothetical protein [Clostridiales bacterium]